MWRIRSASLNHSVYVTVTRRRAELVLVASVRRGAARLPRHAARDHRGAARRGNGHKSQTRGATRGANEGAARAARRGRGESDERKRGGEAVGRNASSAAVARERSSTDHLPARTRRSRAATASWRRPRRERATLPPQKRAAVPLLVAPLFSRPLLHARIHPPVTTPARRGALGFMAARDFGSRRRRRRRRRRDNGATAGGGPGDDA